MAYTEEEREEIFGVEEEHPSYGMIAIRNLTGRFENLFGSSIEAHNNVVAIEIREGTVNHHLSQNWYHGGKIIAEVILSPAQFAEFITTPNVGSGVPCTIRSMRGGDFVRVEEPPSKPVEAKRVKDEFSSKLTKLVSSLRKSRDKMEDIFSGSKPPKKADRQKAINILDMAIQDIESNLPFVVDQFSEATERVVTAAKAEVDTFIMGMVNRTGLKELQKIQMRLEDEDKKKLTE